VEIGTVTAQFLVWEYLFLCLEYLFSLLFLCNAVRGIDDFVCLFGMLYLYSLLVVALSVAFLACGLFAK
jgi:hypothetical protein